VNLAILGATGSIGSSTLDVVARHRSRYRVFALTAHHSADALLALCRAHRPSYAVLSGVPRDAALAAAFAQCGTELLFGIAKLMAQGRLREMKAIARASDAAGFRHGCNQLQMPDLKMHGPSAIGDMNNAHLDDEIMPFGSFR